MRVTAGGREAFEWIAARTGCVLTDQARAIQAVDVKGRIRAVVAYDGWTENACQAHMAADTPIAWRSLTRPAFAYPFEEAGLGIILAVIPANNPRSLSTALRFGFRQLMRLADGWAPGVSLVFLEMRRENCRWLKEVA